MKKFFRKYLKACWRCHGTGLLEKPNGDTMTCPVCKGKGMLE